MNGEDTTKILEPNQHEYCNPIEFTKDGTNLNAIDDASTTINFNSNGNNKSGTTSNNKLIAFDS